MGVLQGRVAIVTGAGRGIGRAIAHKLAREGASVIVSDLDADPATATVAEITAQGFEASEFVGDVTAPGFAEELIQTTLDRYADIDIIVNNAGYIWNSTIQKHSDDQWQAMIDVHATAPFRILWAASHYFREAAKKDTQAGRVHCRKVVNISSVSGVFGAATQLAYSAGKAALVGVTKTLAKEWGRYNITVNCVAFGFIETRLTQPYEVVPEKIAVKGQQLAVGLPEANMQHMRNTIPLGRAGTPEDAAGAVYLLCIPESDYISGQVLVCGGGLTG